MKNQAMNVMKEKEISLWKNRNFLLLWGGTAVSNFGSQMYSVAIPLLIYEMSQSALAMSAMRAIEFFPNIFIGMLAGVLVDRFNRKRMLQWTSLIQVIAMIFIVTLLFYEKIELWHLYLFGFILSSAGYTFGNANHSTIPQIITKEQLTTANAKLTFVSTLISIIGPGIAGSLLVIFSFSSTLAIYTVSLFILFLCMQLLQLPTEEKSSTGNISIWKDMKEGIDELIQNKILLTPTITVLFINFAASLVIGVLIFYVTDQLGATEDEVGLMFSISAIGGLLGASVVSSIRKKWGRGNIYTYCLLFDVVGMVTLIIAPNWWTIGIALGIRTFSTTISNIVYFTIRQEFTPNHLLGRVAGTSSMLMKLTLPLGLTISGLWAEWLPIPILFGISALIIFVLFIRLYFHPFRKLQ
ncbi:MFS transporter [Ornithinibacillus bavariensis]|uniref:MFS transporter n=1 Tax=Ornithinibacillus bavariensis TaxID=545502 RepID=A0A919X650_9BACI|nr:MFS transporter [Ornithinibacillus bavariensis]GIO25568.1 MFS transporter [Ornithinibacillus bavariensis]